MAQKMYSATSRGAVAESREQTEVRVGPQGRVVIPAEIRRILGLKTGAALITHLENGRLVLEKQENICDRVLLRFQKK